MVSHPLSFNCTQTCHVNDSLDRKQSKKVSINVHSHIGESTDWRNIGVDYFTQCDSCRSMDGFGMFMSEFILLTITSFCRTHTIRNHEFGPNFRIFHPYLYRTTWNYLCGRGYLSYRVGCDCSKPGATGHNKLIIHLNNRRFFQNMTR